MRLIFACLICLLPSLSSATPPRVVDIDEKLLAINDTHIFVLRTLSDNFGYHQVTLSDVTLIARNRATGEDDQHWPVLRIRDNGPAYDPDETASRVQNLGLKERVNPHDLVLWRKAWLPFGTGPVFQPDAFTVSADAVIFADYDTTYTASSPRALSNLNVSLGASRDTIPFNPGSGPSSQTFEASLEDPLFLWPRRFDETCEIAEQYLLDYNSGDIPHQFAVKVDCHQNDDPFAVFVILNSAP